MKGNKNDAKRPRLSRRLGLGSEGWIWVLKGFSSRCKNNSRVKATPGTSRHKIDAIVLCAVSTLLHGGLDLHVDTAGFAPAHGVKMELARGSVAADGGSSAGAADVALSRAERW